MYAKLVNNKLTYAPRNYDNGENLISNFNKDKELLKKYGFKEVVDIKPEYNSSTHYLSIDGYIENKNNITVEYKLNEIITNNEPSLEDRVAELERINKEQAELINNLILLNNIKED